MTESQRTERRGRPRDLERRARILDAAARLFAERGFDGMTMEAVAASAEVGKPTVYRWWPNKAALVVDALVGGSIPLPIHTIPEGGDVWGDLREWLGAVAVEVRGPYGDVLRASTAISALDEDLGRALAHAFSEPAEEALMRRLRVAQYDGQLSRDADLGAVVAIAMAMIVYLGLTRDDVDRLTSTVALLRAACSGVEDEAAPTADGR